MAASIFTLATYQKYLFDETYEWLTAFRYILEGGERN